MSRNPASYVKSAVYYLRYIFQTLMKIDEMAVTDRKNKSRVANFSASDRALLLKIVNNNKNIIENKKTDAQTWKQKEKSWNKVQDEFNSSTAGPARTAKQLKCKYESIKRDLKKKHALHSAYMRGTGGGPYVPPPSPPKTSEEKILSQTISLSIQGLSSLYDSDGLAGVSGLNYTQTADVACENNENEDPHTKDERRDDVQEIEIDWSEPNSSLLQTQKSAILKPSIGNGSEHNYCAITEEHGQETVTTESQQSLEKTPQTWHSRRRPVLLKKKCISSVGVKFEILAAKKEELVSIQKAAIEEQRTEHREEHRNRLMLLDLQIEEQKLKNQILLHELNHKT